MARDENKTHTKLSRTMDLPLNFDRHFTCNRGMPVTHLTTSRRITTYYQGARNTSLTEARVLYELAQHESRTWSSCAASSIWMPAT